MIDIGGDDNDWADAITRREMMAAVVRFESDITTAINMEAEAEAQSPLIYLPNDFFPPLIDVKPCRILKTIDVDDDLTIVATTRFIFLERHDFDKLISVIHAWTPNKANILLQAATVQCNGFLRHKKLVSTCTSE